MRSGVPGSGHLAVTQTSWGWAASRAGSQMVQVPNIQGLWSQNPSRVRHLGSETSSIGYLDPLGKPELSGILQRARFELERAFVLRSLQDTLKLLGLFNGSNGSTSKHETCKARQTEPLICPSEGPLLDWWSDLMPYSESNPPINSPLHTCKTQ